MATTKSAGSKAGSRSRQAKSGPSSGARATTKAKSSGSAGTTKRSGSGQARARSTSGRASGSRRGTSNAKRSTLSKAKGPAIAVGTAAAGVAGAVALKSRLGRKRVLGVAVPRSLTNGGLTGMDLQALAKTLGKASKQFGETSKEVSKDIERIGDRAERFGKMLS
jgi:hypothetical protein